MRNSTKKRIGALGIACALTLSLAMSLAYFTDRVEVNAQVTGGTVGISETQTWADNLKNGPQSLDNINPGDSRSLAFHVANTGNKAIDVRHTIKLSVTDINGVAKAMTMGADVEGETMLQFDIFKASDVVKMSNDNNNAGYVLKDGAKPVFSTDTVNSTTKMGASRDDSSISKGIVTYYFADTILDGTGENAETGYAAAEHVSTSLDDTKDVVLDGKTAVNYDYILIFRDTTLNDFQGCTLHVEMVVEAKQHLNTMSSWQNIETIQYDMVVSGDTTQDTSIQTAPNNHIGVLEDVTDETAGTYNNNTAH